jgi:uncharacterized protein (TIGR02757 family)
MQTAKEQKLESLGDFLDQLLETIDWTEHRKNDPVEHVWKFNKNCNRELTALIASCLAYGRVEQIQMAIDEVMHALGTEPAQQLDNLTYPELQKRLGDFNYRMTGAEDMLDLLWSVRALRRKYGGLEACYRAADGHKHVEKASNFVQILRQRRYRHQLERGFRYLLPDPADGSASKRLNLFFRWMGRPPGPIDPGCWSDETLPPRNLLVPLDTHTSRIARYIGLTDRKSVDLKAARQVTDSLRNIDSKDPTKYDFALCHLGISEQCIHEYSAQHCPDCPIFEVCSIGGKQGK